MADLAVVYLLSVRISYCNYPTTQPLLLFRSPPQVLVATLLLIVHTYHILSTVFFTLGARLVHCLYCVGVVAVVVFFTLTDRASTIPSSIRGCQSGTWSAGEEKIRRTSTKLQREHENNLCAVIPFILDVRLVDTPAGVTQEED